MGGRMSHNRAVITPAPLDNLCERPTDHAIAVEQKWPMSSPMPAAIIC